MKILVIDGKGGKMGRRIVEELCAKYPTAEITAVGTNSTATENMLRGGAENAATGENPVRVATARADIIVGPVGIAIADSLFGEVTPAMALSVAQSDAVRILLPVNRCDSIIVGTEDIPSNELIDKMIKAVDDAVRRKNLIG